jgi:hypothetical protein
MQYLLLIYDDEQRYAAMSDEERGALHQEYSAFTNELLEHEAMVGGAQLQPTAAGSRVRVRDEELVVTDGPFTETKEQLGGYYLVEAETLDEALEWAAKIPSARIGTIEVRPVAPVPAPAAAA